MNSFALIFHGTNDDRFNQYMDEEENEGVKIFSHPISLQSGKAVIGAGTRFGRKDQERLSGILGENLTEKLSLLPRNVIAKTPTAMVWCKPKCKDFISFHSGKEKQAERWMVPHPNLLFKLNRGVLSVVAYEGEGIPNESTRLYNAPYGNIYRDSTMCVGANKIPTSAKLSDIASIEEMFTESEFTHSNMPSLLVGIESWDEHKAFWRSLKGKRNFPMKKLYRRYRNDKISTVSDWVSSAR